MHSPRTDADEPRWGIWVASQQLVGSREEVFCHLVGAGFDIDSNDLAFIAGFDLRTYLTLIDLVPTACELFFAIPPVSHGHDDSPMLVGAQGALSAFPQRYSTILVARESCQECGISTCRGLTPAFSCCRKRERGTSGRCRQSAARRCSSKPLTRQSCSLSLRPSMSSPVSSCSHRPRVTSRRERSHAPTAATHDGGSPPPWHGRASPGSRRPCSTPLGAVLSHRARRARRTGAAALLPAPEQRRRPRSRVPAPLLAGHPLLLPARPHARLAPPHVPARAHHPPSPRRAQHGGRQAAPHVRHPLPPPGLLSHRLARGTAAPGSPRPTGLRHCWPAPPGPCPPRHGRPRPGRPPARRDPPPAPPLLAHAAAHDLALAL